LKTIRDRKNPRSPPLWGNMSGIHRKKLEIAPTNNKGTTSISAKKSIFGGFWPVARQREGISGKEEK
jgi:hypothetical protein